MTNVIVSSAWALTGVPPGIQRRIASKKRATFFSFIFFFHPRKELLSFPKSEYE